MSRSERWSNANEIRRTFHDIEDPAVGAGPILCTVKGRKYTDDGQSHIAVIGRTGKGKSQCCSLPCMHEIFRKGESLIMLDPKGEGYKLNACYIPEEYRVFCVDFRNPRRSPTGWNPLSMPYRLFCSSEPDDHDIASSMLSELWAGVYPWDGHSDRFWPDASANYAKGLTYGLFETAKSEDEVNLNNVAVMMEQSEVRTGMENTVKAFYEELPPDSLARRNLATYVTAPNETRASIHSVAASGLEVFSRSVGLMEMLADDTLNLMEIDVDRPFALICITPDETDVYDALCGLLISQVTQHLIRVAQERGGRLPIRVNLILEELGSVGKSIPSLPNLMVASRSRNMRLMLVLQSTSQLVDVYGKSKAETIYSSIGITIGFSTNNWENLSEWAQRCGERQVERDGHLIKEPLITAAQLAAMPTGTALILFDSRLKIIARLPFFYELCDSSEWKAPEKLSGVPHRQLQAFSFENMVKEMKSRRIDRIMRENHEERTRPERSRFGRSSDAPKSREDIQKLMDRIDERIAALEAEEAEEKSKKYLVIICREQGSREKIVQAISAAACVAPEKAAAMYGQLPVKIRFAKREEAMRFLHKILQAGGDAQYRGPDDDEPGWV